MLDNQDVTTGPTDFPAAEPSAMTSRGEATVGVSDDAGRVDSTTVLGVPVSCINLDSAKNTILGWAAHGRSNYVCVRDVHGVMRARSDGKLHRAHQHAGMVTPDGMPLVWILRGRRGRTVSRVCGNDLVDTLCANSPSDVRHYFYGGKPGVAEKMAATLRQRYPSMEVAGTGCPPFRQLSPEEERAEVDHIAAAKPQIVWVGLSTPKQELWMERNVGLIPGATLIGVGAAFDFQTGLIQRAPRWMQESGLEWLHRLASEPRRLWRRYLLLAPQFVFLVLLETLGGGLRKKAA
jgi:N-acetylglucosaminyldiphosphoundecaprenol N-acetyl-beta-D-mannosaminyltransferase